MYTYMVLIDAHIAVTLFIGILGNPGRAAVELDAVWRWGNHGHAGHAIDIGLR